MRNRILAILLVSSIMCPVSWLLCATTSVGYAQDELEVSVDLAAATVPLPKIYQPGIDLGGRGYHRDFTWPQEMASKEAIDAWGQDIGFKGLFRVQYNLWEIHQLERNKPAQDKLLANYEFVIKQISDSGGTVILDVFGTPAGLGKVLDKKSPPLDMRVYKELVKSVIKNLSCEKKYNIWYEVWSTPDEDGFFLGRRQEYLLLYRAVAQAVLELERFYKIHIPLGGPSTSWWFQSPEGSTILTPERSLVYDLIKFCYSYRLPLDFLSWHAFSSSPFVDKEITVYKKSAAQLVRFWLESFRFSKDTPLIIDEWNYDRDFNILPERGDKSYVSASYLISRIKNMRDAGIDRQVYFALEDFQNNKEGVVRNVGAFYFDSESSGYKGGAKSVFNAFRMLNLLQGNLIPVKLDDDFAGAVATRSEKGSAVLIYNYIDAEAAANYLSQNISSLDSGERNTLFDLIKSDKFSRLMSSQQDIQDMRVSGRLKNLLKAAQALNDRAKKFQTQSRTLKLSIKNLKTSSSYLRYAVDSGCSLNCEFKPVESKDIAPAEVYEESLNISPYSLQLIIVNDKPAEPVKSDNAAAQ